MGTELCIPLILARARFLRFSSEASASEVEILIRLVDIENICSDLLDPITAGVSSWIYADSSSDLCLLVVICNGTVGLSLDGRPLTELSRFLN